MFTNIEIKQKDGHAVITGEKKDGSIHVFPIGLKEIAINKKYKEVSTISLTYYVSENIRDETGGIWGLERKESLL